MSDTHRPVYWLAGQTRHAPPSQDCSQWLRSRKSGPRGAYARRSQLQGQPQIGETPAAFPLEPSRAPARIGEQKLGSPSDKVALWIIHVKRKNASLCYPRHNGLQQRFSAKENSMAAPDLDLMVIVDVICPWCYVGKRRMEKALPLLDSNIPVHVSWLPFELNPGMPKEGMERREYRMRKFGSWERSLQLDAQLAEAGVQEGLTIRYDLQTRTPNTFDAHRLIRRAGMGGSQTGLVEALFQAYFTQGRDIGSPETLADIAAENGMDRADALAFLGTDELADQVRQYEGAAQNAGITGVPAFVANRRPVLMGAHPPETIAAALSEVMGLAPAP